MKRISLLPRERTLVKGRDVCRIATITKDGWPHCVPVGYLYRKGQFYIPANKNSKKVRNLRANPRASITIDNEGEMVLVIQGLVEIVEGVRFSKLRRWMIGRTVWTIDESTSVVLVLIPWKKAIWNSVS